MVVAVFALGAGGFLTTGAAVAQPAGYGPSDPFDDALMGNDGPVEPLKNQAKIVRTRFGYRFTAGQQHSHLRVSRVKGGLRFHDSGTRAWKSLPRGCRAQKARGVAAVCRVPASTRAANHTLLEIHPRLGNDFVDGRTLPAAFDMAVLADAGRDTVFTGRGNDFINGAHNLDRAYAGAGNDWIRGGDGNDRLGGGTGRDYIVGQDGRDAINGGSGANRIYS